MKSVQDIAKAILAREGGYVNDPDDPGGATNHGVTVHTMRRLGLDLNGDGKVDAQDVRVLTAEKALQIFVDEYFHKPGLGALPEPLQASVFDMYVNAGGNAVKILQRLLNQMRISVAVDGVIGPQTDAGHSASHCRSPRSFCGCLRDCAAQLLLWIGRCTCGEPQICPQAKRRLDRACRRVSIREIPSECSRT